MWCEDRRNGVIIADFAVQGTLAREVLGSPAEVMTRAGVKVGFASASSSVVQYKFDGALPTVLALNVVSAMSRLRLHVGKWTAG